MLMERKYYRNFNPSDACIPKPKPCPPAKPEPPCAPEPPCNPPRKNFEFHADDIILLALIVVLLMEEEKDYLTIGILAAVFLSEYIF